jgi:hypothetical protein
MAPSGELEKIGVRKEGKMAYELTSGEVKEYPCGLPHCCLYRTFFNTS